MKTQTLNYLKLMRPKHYLKNALVFVPLMYSFRLTEPTLLASVAIVFAALCLVSSGVYALNDIADCEKDKTHPRNKTRPIASGLISKPAAALFALLLFAAGGALAARHGAAIYFVGGYVLLNLAYSFKLKHVAVIDCFCIAAGFVLRVYAGGAVIGEFADVSEWLFLTITAVSLFFAFGKRRGEMLNIGGFGRKVLANYNIDFLNGIIFSCAGISVIFYALWAIESDAPMVYTVPLVIFIICKYLLNIYSGSSYGDPVTVILGDKILIGATIIFGAVSLFFLYGGI
ncbi:MAG: UbiA prenyltransferase family protein [Defluviitaleaceae bacterium]|nr:UbiA prenyltransferase family protein [Defluviitaleaceae bacterium]